LAIKPASNEAFYREVDEELRRDQLKSVWQRYGWFIVGGIVLLLALLAGFIWWQNRQQAERGVMGETLTAVFSDVQAQKTKEVAPRLDRLAEEGSAGYRAAALLTKADVAIQEGNDAAAIAAFKAVAEDEELAEPYRNLALIRQTTLEFDKLPAAQVIQRLRPLAQAGSPWFGSAGELVALAHLKQQQSAEAARIFAAIAKDRTLPRSMRSRAVQMAGALGVDATQELTRDAETAAAAKENKE
jgi:hypothetical protein